MDYDNEAIAATTLVTTDGQELSEDNTLHIIQPSALGFIFPLPALEQDGAVRTIKNNSAFNAHISFAGSDYELEAGASITYVYANSINSWVSINNSSGGGTIISAFYEATIFAGYRREDDGNGNIIYRLDIVPITANFTIDPNVYNLKFTDNSPAWHFFDGAVDVTTLPIGNPNTFEWGTV